MAKRKHEINEDESDEGTSKTTKSKSVSYGDVTVYYFHRVQSFTCIPSLGGIALGLSSTHYYTEQKPLSDTSDELTEHCNIEPLTAQKRKKLLRLSGVKRWKKSELKHAREIRLSRLNCGCNCGDFCFPQTCSCCLNGIGCQVDEGTFPCSCRPNCCLNVEGRHGYDSLSIARHRMETLDRAQENSEI